MLTTVADGRKFLMVRHLSQRLLNWSKTQFLSTLPLFGAPLGVIPSKFCRDLLHQKFTAPGLSCGVVFEILHLAILYYTGL